MVQVKKFTLGDDWVPKKLGMYILTFVLQNIVTVFMLAKILCLLFLFKFNIFKKKDLSGMMSVK